MVKRLRDSWSAPTLQCRSFQAGDEIEIGQLWARAYGDLSWHFVRDVEYWKWAIFDRGGTAPRGVLLVLEGPRLVAYGAMTPLGVVLDIAVDPDLGPRRWRAAFDLLAASLEQLGREYGCHEMCCEIPPTDLRLWKALRKQGYYSENMGKMSMGIGDPVALLNAILSKREPTREIAESGIRLEISPGNYKEIDRLQLILAENRVSPCSTPPPISLRHRVTILVRIDMTSLTDLVFGNATAGTLLESGKISVEPSHVAPTALRWLDSLTLKGAHFLPASDVF